MVQNDGILERLGALVEELKLDTLRAQLAACRNQLTGWRRH